MLTSFPTKKCKKENDLQLEVLTVTMSPNSRKKTSTFEGPTPDSTEREGLIPEAAGVSWVCVSVKKNAKSRTSLVAMLVTEGPDSKPSERPQVP